MSIKSNYGSSIFWFPLHILFRYRMTSIDHRDVEVQQHFNAMKKATTEHEKS